MDEFESPEVQKDFPGLFTPGTSKVKKEEHELPEPGASKKKKDKDKDKGYATLAGDSSPEEDGDTKSPSKSTKRIKAFKFPLKKREKSREKDISGTAIDRDILDAKEKPEKEKKTNKKKKIKPDEPVELGEALPIFGVSLSLAVERSRCHDIENPLPLVVRDCIDYLQEFGVMNEGIYKVEPNKSKLHQLKKLYNSRDSNGFNDLDVATAAGLLKLFLKELPEPMLTTDLVSQFEEVSAISDVQDQEAQLKELVRKLPKANETLLKWVSLHLDAVTENESIHKMNAQSLAMILSPTLQMSQRLFVTILCHCRSLFILATNGSVLLPRYIPPLTGANPILPESPEGILQELKKQESLLSQIHSEMNSGFVTKRREEQLWEVQRIITQLKRKLRQFEKKPEGGQKSIEDTVDSTSNDNSEIGKVKSSDDEGSSRNAIGINPEISSPPSEGKDDTMYAITETGFLTLPEDHPGHDDFIKLQLENYELQRFREKLQAAINNERVEINSIQRQLNELNTDNTHADEILPANSKDTADDSERQLLLAQNAYLKAVKQMLEAEIMAENQRIVEDRVQLGLKEILGK